MTQDSASAWRILVPLDGSEAGLEVLRHVEPLAHGLGAEVVLLRAIPGLAETLAGSHVARDVAMAAVADDERAAKEFLETTAGPLRASGLKVETIVGEGAPAACILKHVEGFSFVALTTHSRYGISRTLFGSVADDVIRRSPVPVIVIHPGKG